MRIARSASLLLALGLALLPAPAGAQPPDPQGDLVYEDDFSSAAKSGLEDNVSASDYQRGFHPPGVYHLRLTTPNEVRWSLLPNQSYGQISLQADLWDNSDAFQGDVSHGLVFRAQDGTHLYAALIDPRQGRYGVRKLDGRRWSDIIAMTASPLVKRRAEVNVLRVDADGDSFDLYLNGEALASFSDSSYPRGGVGLITANVDAVEPHMHFDNLKIYSAEAPAVAIPAALPATGAAAGAGPVALAALAALMLVSGAALSGRTRRAVVLKLLPLSRGGEGGRG